MALAERFQATDIYKQPHAITVFISLSSKTELPDQSRLKCQMNTKIMPKY